jgi:cysteine-rich repeat protein
MKRNMLNGAVALAAAMIVAGAGGAAADIKAEKKCASAKLTAVGSDFGAQTACHAAALSKGVAVEPACIMKATTRTSDAFAKAETKAAPKGGCATDANGFDLNLDTISDGQLASIRNQIDSGFNIGAALIYSGLFGPVVSAVNEGIVNSLVTTPGAESKCTSIKLKEAGKLAKAFYTCEKKVVSKNLPVDPACKQKAIDNMVAKYAAEEAKPGADCQTTGDANLIAGRVNGSFGRITPSIPRFDGCGNGLITAGETCDDFNEVDFDTCPADCTIAACTPTANPQPATLTVNRSDVASVIVELDYPEGIVSLPGTGFSPDVVQLTLGTMDALDFDHAARFVFADVMAFGQNELATLNFVDCSGANPPGPAVGDFTCFVRDAALAGGVKLSKAQLAATTCTVTIP